MGLEHGRRAMNRFMDRLRGYCLLCRLCRRPVFVIPPRLSEILDLAWRGDESLERYMASMGFELAPDESSATNIRPQSFRELQMSAKSSAAPTEPPAAFFRKIRNKPRKKSGRR